MLKNSLKNKMHYFKKKKKRDKKNRKKKQNKMFQMISKNLCNFQQLNFQIQD